MRMLLVILVCSCSSVSAQSFFFPNDSAVIKEVDLPAEEPFDTARSYLKVKTPYIYLVSDNDVYNLFGYNTYIKYYKFDFSDYHILGEQKCNQCLLHCRHDEGQADCHRNQCNLEWKWVMRENKKAFTEISSSTMLGHIRKDLPKYNDTVITSAPDTSRWYTTGRGDCFASFKYAVIADNQHSVLILKEWNYWGGCRAGGSKDYTITFNAPKGVLYKVKRTILMEKDLERF